MLPKIFHNKKSWKSFFLIFWVTEKTFSPLFSKTAGPIRLEIFLWVVQPNSGVHFFFFEISFQENLAAFTKFLLAEKKGSDRDFTILLLVTFVDGIFQKENTPRVVSSYHKNISARCSKVSIFSGGGEGEKFW